MLSEKELKTAERLEKKLISLQPRNQELYSYYQQTRKTKDLGINVPRHMRDTPQNINWVTLGIDLQLERVQCDGFYSASEEEAVAELSKIFRQNNFLTGQKQFMLDAMVTGCGYLSIGVGYPEQGEPDVLWRAESPLVTYGEWNVRSQRLENCIKILKTGLGGATATLWLPNVTIGLTRKNSTGVWVETYRDEHNQGYIPIVSVHYAPTTSHPRGTTAISKTQRTLSDNAQRTLLAAEVTREYFANPLRAIEGGSPLDYLDDDGLQKAQLDNAANGIMSVPYNAEDGVQPRLTQLSTNSPVELLQSISYMAKIVASDIGVPASALGVEAVQGVSADAQIEANKVLLSKVARSQEYIKTSIKEIMRITVEMLEIEADIYAIEPEFMRAETNTPAAQADRIVKLNSAGIFDKVFPDYVYRDLGMNALEIAQQKVFLEEQGGENLMTQILLGNAEVEAVAEEIPEG